MSKLSTIKNNFAIAVFTIGLLQANSLSAQLLKLPGSFSVSSSGGASYFIPIQVPPGSAGMQPSISLDYSSQGHNDLMGIGWSIGGLSSITRCSATIAQDGPNEDEGRFCMGGKRLVAFSDDHNEYYFYDPNYWWYKTEYRTEVDSYLRITAGGDQGYGPEVFTVYNEKTGQILEFGGTSDSQLKDADGNTVLTWYLNKVSDPTDKNYRITYAGASNGYVYPTEIKYTYPSHSGTGSYNSVEFEYDLNRPDPIRIYRDGEEVVVNALLTNIKTYNFSNLVHDYQISYETGADDTRPSRVSAITQCDDTSPTPLCLPSTTFTWPAANDPVSHLTPIDHYSSSVDPGVATNDYNGDGLPDFFRGIYGGDAKYWMSTEPGEWIYQSKDVEGLGSYTYTGYPAELDGDGYTDLVVDTTSSYRKSNVLNDGTGELEYGTSGNGGANSDAFPFGDMDGDGRDDLLYLGSSNATPYFSDGDGTYTEGDEIDYLDSSASIFAGDFNGDGCIDVLEDDTSSAEYVRYSCDASPSSRLVYLGGDYVLGDFNGDGKTDILDVDDSTGELKISTGDDFDEINLSGVSDWDDYQMHTGDFNGDGKDDVALISTSTSITHKVYLSEGNGFESSPSMTITNASGSLVQGSVHDFNGDGAADIWVEKSSSNYLYLTDYEPQLISEINDGLGQTITITYDRLNDNSTSGGVYTKDTDAEYPVKDVVGGQYVVSEVSRPNGVGGENDTSYEYEGLKYNQEGRGMMGFRKIIVTDPNDIVTTTTYKQDYPYTGLVEQITQVSGSVTLKSVTNTYSNTSPLGEEGGDAREVFLDEREVVRKDLNGASLPDVTTSYTYDTYGNVSNETIDTAGGHLTAGGSTRSTSYTYDHSSATVATFLTGLVETNSVTYKLYNSPSISRKNEYEYNSEGSLVSVIIEPNKSWLKLTTDYTLDGYGNVLTTTVSGTDIATQVTTNTYDWKGRFVTTKTNAEGHVEEFAYNFRLGVLTSYTDPNDLESTFEYDTFGRLTKETTPDSRSRVTTYSYCSGVAGGSATCPIYGAMEIEKTPYRSDGTTQSGPAVKSVVDKLGRQILAGSEAFNGSDWSIGETFYDSLGRVQKTTLPYLDSGSADQYTTYVYDDLGRVTSSLTYPDSSSTAYTYNGLTSTVNNGLNQDKTTVLNNQGLIASVTEEGDTTGSGDDIVTTYEYDAAGNLLVVTDPEGNEITNDIDIRGRVKHRTDPSLGTWDYEYTVLDQLKLQTDAENQDTSYTYDKLGRLTSLVAEDMTSTFTYDTATNGVGRLDEMSTDDGNERIHYYDSLGRPSQTRLTIDSGNYDYFYSYNGDGRLDTVEYPSGYEVRYEYTNTQRYLKYLKEDSSGDTLWTADTRNAAGQVTQATMNLSNSFTVNRTYDAYGRITDVEAGTSNVIADFTYTYDKLGNLTQRQDFNESVTESFAFDAMNRMTGATIGSTTRSVAYDDVGNITSKTRLGSTNTNTYTYPTPGNDQPYSVSSITGFVNGITNPTFAYDDNGNMTSGAGRSVTWNSFNRVASMTEGSMTVSYVYDAEHQRVKQDDGTVVTLFLTDPVSGLDSEYLDSDGGTYNDYLFAGGRRVGVRTEKTSPSSTTFSGFVHDNQRSIAVVTDSSGNVVQDLAYDVWGRRRGPDGTEDPTGAITAPTTRGFTDHQHLPGGVNGIHLINMNARIYDPEIGRFMSADPIIPNVFSSKSLNRLTYVENNPGTMIDPTGFEGDCPEHCPDENWRSWPNRRVVSIGDWEGWRAVYTGPISIIFGSFNTVTNDTTAPDGSTLNENLAGFIDLGVGNVHASEDNDYPEDNGEDLLEYFAQGLSNVIGTPEMDTIAIEALDAAFQIEDEFESAFEIINTSDGIITTTPESINSDIFSPLDEEPGLIGVGHVHVESLINDRNETLNRELPGPADHLPLERWGVPNYFRTPQGNIRVLEYIDGRYSVRTIRGDDARGQGSWRPGRCNSQGQECSF